MCPSAHRGPLTLASSTQPWGRGFPGQGAQLTAGHRSPWAEQGGRWPLPSPSPSVDSHHLPSPSWGTFTQPVPCAICYFRGKTLELLSVLLTGWCDSGVPPRTGEAGTAGQEPEVRPDHLAHPPAVEHSLCLWEHLSPSDGHTVWAHSTAPPWRPGGPEHHIPGLLPGWAFPPKPGLARARPLLPSGLRDVTATPPPWVGKDTGRSRPGRVGDRLAPRLVSGSPPSTVPAAKPCLTFGHQRPRE